MPVAKQLRRWMIGIPMVVLPFLMGGARPWFWSPVAAGFMLGIAGLLWTEPRPDLTKGLSRRTLLVLGLLLAYPFLQAFPLPGEILGLLSPQRALWLQRVEELTHFPAQASGVSYVPLITSFSGLWWVFLLAYALLFRKMIQEEEDVSLFFGILFAFAGFQAFYGLLQVLFPSMGVLWENKGEGIARGTFINRNHYAAFLGMIWPVLLAYVLGLSRKSYGRTVLPYYDKEWHRQVFQKQFFLAFIVGLVLLALFFSRSRGGIIGALIAVTVFVGFGGIRGKGAAVFVGVCWMILFSYGSLIGFDGIIARFNSLDAEAAGRLEVWKDSWPIIAEHPLTGTGLGSYGSVFQIYQTHMPEDMQCSHAHNDYLQLVAELGWPVAAGTVVLVWGYWWKTGWGIRKRGKRKTGEERLQALGALSGSAAFLWHGWVEFNWQIPANQLYFLMLLVLMEAENKGLSAGMTKEDCDILTRLKQVGRSVGGRSGRSGCDRRELPDSKEASQGTLRVP